MTGAFRPKVVHCDFAVGALRLDSRGIATRFGAFRSWDIQAEGHSDYNYSVHFLLHMRITYHVVNMAQVMPVAFSPTGEYFAYSSPDGTLKLWETATGTLKQEYTPSSHLSATCTCLAWCPSSKSNVSWPRPVV